MKLELSSITKYFDETAAVNKLSFSVSSGEVTAFVGPNGAGKTTALRIAAGVEFADSGLIRVDGDSITNKPEQIARLIGFVPDTLPSCSDINVYEYLDFFARAYKIYYSRRIKLLDELMSFTGLNGIKDKMLSALSKGMKQRVSLARALINDPPFILMDEPAAGLDPRARVELRELIKILSEQSKGILISSHILSELSEICTSVVIIERGCLLQKGSLEEVMKTLEAKTARKIAVKLLDGAKEFLSFILTQPYVDCASETKDGVEFDFCGTESEASSLLRRSIEAGHKVLEFGFQRRNLETLFMSVTKGNVQ